METTKEVLKSMSKIIKSVCFAFLVSCANVPIDTESVTTAYDELVAGAATSGTAGYHSGGKAGTSGKAGGGDTAGYHSGGTTGTSGTAGYHSGGTAGISGTSGTAGTGNIAGNTICWENNVLPTPFGDDTEANQAANNGAEAGWDAGYAMGCADDEESKSRGTSTLNSSNYFYCWPGGRHRFCVYAAAWATARACVSLSCEGRTVSACAYASAYAFAWSCAGPRWYYWW